MAKSSEIAEAFAQLALVRDKGDAAARHLSELCADNPEMMRKAAEAFAEHRGNFHPMEGTGTRQPATGR